MKNRGLVSDNKKDFFKNLLTNFIDSTIFVLKRI
jgi:hypothetical protein